MNTETEILKEWPFAERSSRYPWDAWFDGEMRVLVHGTHFDGDASSLRSSIYQAAKRWSSDEKVRVHTFTAEECAAYGDGRNRIALQASIGGKFKKYSSLSAAEQRASEV